MRAQKFTQPAKVKLDVQKREGIPPQKKPPPPRFFYFLTDRSWEFVEGLGFLPRPKKANVVAGVNGTRIDPQTKQLDPSGMLAGLMSSGRRVIAPDDPRLGEDYMYYVHAYEMQNGGKWHVEFATEITVLASGALKHNSDAVQDQWQAFQVHLRDSGIAEPLLAVIYEEMREKEEAKLDKMVSRTNAQNAAFLGPKIEAQTKRVDALKAAWAKLCDEQADETPIPQPKRSRVRRTK